MHCCLDLVMNHSYFTKGKKNQTQYLTLNGCSFCRSVSRHCCWRTDLIRAVSSHTRSQTLFTAVPLIINDLCVTQERHCSPKHAVHSSSLLGFCCCLLLVAQIIHLHSTLLFSYVSIILHVIIFFWSLSKPNPSALAPPTNTHDIRGIKSARWFVHHRSLIHKCLTELSGAFIRSGLARLHKGSEMAQVHQSSRPYSTLGFQHKTYSAVSIFSLPENYFFAYVSHISDSDHQTNFNGTQR